MGFVIACPECGKAFPVEGELYTLAQIQEAEEKAIKECDCIDCDEGANVCWLQQTKGEDLKCFGYRVSTYLEHGTLRKQRDEERCCVACYNKPICKEAVLIAVKGELDEPGCCDWFRAKGE